MIESNILNWIDIHDSLHYLDVYSSKGRINFSYLFYILMEYKTFSIFFYILFKCFFFLQIIMLTLTNIKDENDSALKILDYISTVVLIQQIVEDSLTYKIAAFITTILTFVIIICFIYISISITIGKFYLYLPMYLLNFINILLMNYLIGPIFQLIILSTNCRANGQHIYLNVTCYSDTYHIVIFVFSIVNLAFFFVFSFILSIYYNEVGSVNENKVFCRINCKYEIYINISKMLMFLFAYYIQFYGNENMYLLRILLQIFILLNSLFFAIYCYNTVLFYNNLMDIITTNGWSYVAWFSFVILMKSLLNIYDTSIFHLGGWTILTFIIYFIQSYREEYLLTDINIFEVKTLKEIEEFNLKLYNLINIRSNKNKTLLMGITHKFEKYFSGISDLNEKYNKFCSNEIFQKKFNSSHNLPILTIIFLIYDYHLEKSQLKNEILIAMSYFLMNKFKNVYFAIFICSKLKVTNHFIAYYKFTLMEEIKKYLICKLTKTTNNDSMKHVQIGSVILYNMYTEMFKIKIIEAANNQIEYFDILRNNSMKIKSTEHFLFLGEEILNLRSEIMNLWKKILELNPFSEESENDYKLYLETIIQDDVLAKNEMKKFNTLKNNKLSERTNMYYSLFIKDISGVVLVDGYCSIGKILYSTPNYPSLFHFSKNELSNMYITDLMPNVVAKFHHELMENVVKFSSFSKVFSKQVNILLKGKTGGIYNVNLFIKCLPNFSFGLIYIVNISKIQDQNFIIVLDKDFNINGLTDTQLPKGSHSSINASNYGLTKNVIGNHIALIIPEMLMQLEYVDSEYVISKIDIDLKGNLYPTSRSDLNKNIENLIEKIKQNGKLLNDDAKREGIQEYEDFINEMNTKYQKNFGIFFRITTQTFLNDKYKYHRIYVTNDLIALNENSHYIQSVRGSNAESLNLNEEKVSQTNSKKRIKLRGMAYEEDIKELLSKTNENGNNHDNNNKQNKNAIKKNEKKAEIKYLEGGSSVQTLSSLDSSLFNKLKNGILNQKEVTSIKAMKFLGFFYGLFTILLIYLSYVGGVTTFQDINEYLKENLFFNHTKIDVSCAYLASTNMKWEKYGLIPETNCYFSDCSLFYPNLLSNCIVEMKLEKENSTFFHQDFKNILKKEIECEIEIFQMEAKKKLSLDIENLYTFIISNGLNLNSNKNAYRKQSNTITETVSSNLNYQTLLLLQLEINEGFTYEERKINIEKISSILIIVPLIVDALLFTSLILSYSILIFKLYNMESQYLGKLIQFNSPGFELYLKKLEELKKTFKNDNENDEEKEEEEEKNKGKESEIHPSNNNTENKKKLKQKDDVYRINKKSKKPRKDKDKQNEIEKEKQALNKKKKREQKQKSEHLKDTKIKVMTGYFLKWNICFTIKVMLVFIIALSYFVVISITEKIGKSNLLDYDKIIDSIEGIYKLSFDLFLEMKKKLADYIDYEIERMIAIKCIDDETCLFFKLNKTNVSKDSYTKEILEALPPFQMTPILKTEVTLPKLNSFLMPLINNKRLNQEQVTLLNILYNGDACSVLFSNTTDQEQYAYCSSFWSGILVKGMEQSITQMGVMLNSVKEEINSIIGNPQKLAIILNKQSSFSQFEFFVEYYLLFAYLKTNEIFQTMKNNKLNQIGNDFLIILLVYIVTVVILIILVLHLIHLSRKKFNSFLNFIGILPIKYISEDKYLYKCIIELEQKIF